MSGSLGKSSLEGFVSAVLSDISLTWKPPKSVMPSVCPFPWWSCEGGCEHFCFRNGGRKAQRGQVTHPVSHSEDVAEQQFHWSRLAPAWTCFSSSSFCDILQLWLWL